MKFESKFGLDEVLVYNESEVRGNRSMPDQLVKVINVSFNLGGEVTYLCEYVSNQGVIHRITLHESLLTGDPDFDQETGYPSEE